jgi:hypothetical protein
VTAWNVVNQFVADEVLYQEAPPFATRLFRLGGIDAHHTSSGSFEER